MGQAPHARLGLLPQSIPRTWTTVPGLASPFPKRSVQIIPKISAIRIFQPSISAAPQANAPATALEHLGRSSDNSGLRPLKARAQEKRSDVISVIDTPRILSTPADRRELK
jgi:hypothetical protein